jgi:CRISPR-associated endoribonuclease Cas6
MRMRLTLSVKKNEKLILPTNYNHLVQAAIYHNISRELADFLHEEGFLVGKRRFKLFTFSRLDGRYILDRIKKQFVYMGDLILYISSPLEKFIKDIANTIVKKGSLFLGNNQLNVAEIAFPAQPVIKKGDVKIRMLSPLTVYSTLLTSDGKKKTYYYSPYEEEFSMLVEDNVKKKHFLLSGKNIKSNINIMPLKVREVVIVYKGTVVKGWMGYFILNGPVSLIRTAYDVGLGAKNSQGFGMFEVSKC